MQSNDFFFNIEDGLITRNYLVAQFKSLNTFEDKLVLWHSIIDKRPLSASWFDNSGEFLEYEELRKTHDSSHPRMVEITNNWKQKDIDDGLFEPKPNTDEEKIFTMNVYIKTYGKEPVPSFEEYKNELFIEIPKQINKKKYIEGRIQSMKNELNVWKSQTEKILYSEGSTNYTLMETLENMANNSYQIDYVFLYDIGIKSFTLPLPSLATLLKKFVSRVQFKLFLENYDFKADAITSTAQNEQIKATEIMYFSVQNPIDGSTIFERSKMYPLVKTVIN